VEPGLNDRTVSEIYYSQTIIAVAFKKLGLCVKKKLDAFNKKCTRHLSAGVFCMADKMKWSTDV